MAQIFGGANDLTVTIPPARSPVVSVIILLMLVGWVWVALANMSVIRAISDGDMSGGGDLLVLLFVAGLLFFLANALYALTKEVFRIERVKVRSGVLSITKTTLGVGDEKIYDTSDVRNLRVGDLRGPYLQGWAFGSRNGRIVFEYEGAEVRFGEALNESEAKRIVTALRGSGMA